MEDDEFGLDSDVLEAVDFIIAGAGQAAGSVRAVSFPHVCPPCLTRPPAAARAAVGVRCAMQATDSRSPPAAAAAASADERFMEIHLPAAPAQRPPEVRCCRCADLPLR